MANLSRLTRSDLILAGFVLAVLFLFFVAARTPYLELCLVVYIVALVLLGVSEWRSKGRGWVPTISWAIPVGGSWIVAQVFIDRPFILIVLAFWIGSGVMLTMIVSDRAARWWYRVVLRRPYG